MVKFRCIACGNTVTKSSSVDAYTCRDCERGNVPHYQWLDS